MQVHNNEITVHRGETFTVSKIIRNRDYSPYIVSSKLANPYWLLTVTSSRYNQANRYVLNKWLNLAELPRFEFTKPVPIGDGLRFETAQLPFGYEGDETSGYANVAVFTDGNEYKYWVYDNTDEDDFAGHWEDYECKFTTLFGNDVTSDWSEQTYLYSIFLVSGNSTYEYLKTTCEMLGITLTEDVVSMYNEISKIDPSLVESIENPERPIVRCDVVYPILASTKINVKTTTKGVIY